MTDTPQQPTPPPEQPAPEPQQPAPEPQQPAPPQPDMTFAWLAHLLMLFTWFIGPLVIWLVKKDEDKYAAFHGKQAMCWSLAVTALVFCVYMLMLLLVFVIGPGVGFLICLVWLALLGNLAYVVVGIVYTAQGKPFKYFFVADQFCKNEFAAAYPEAAGQA